MKKIVAILLLAATVFTLASCKKDPTPGPDADVARKALETFASAVSNSGTPKEINIEVKMTKATETLTSEYKIVYDEKGDAVISATLEVANDLTTAMETGKTKRTEVKAARYEDGALYGDVDGMVGTVTANAISLSYEKLTDLVIEGNTLSAKIPVANVPDVFGVSTGGSDMTVFMVRALDGISTITLNYTDANGFAVETAIGYTY